MVGVVVGLGGILGVKEGMTITVSEEIEVDVGVGVGAEDVLHP
jgi:hypothetical protein